MRILTLTLLLIVSILMFACTASASSPTQLNPGEIVAQPEEPGLLAQVMGVALVFLIAGIGGFLLLRRSRAGERSTTEAVKNASRLSPEDRATAVHRITTHSGREGSYHQVFVYDELARNFHTYRAAYELIVRGFQVRFYSEPPNADFNFGKSKMRRMDLSKAEIFSTGSLAPHIPEMSSIAQFSRHVPYRSRNKLALVVHSKDLEETYRLFLELGIRRVGIPTPSGG